MLRLRYSPVRAAVRIGVLAGLCYIALGGQKTTAIGTEPISALSDPIVANILSDFDRSCIGQLGGSNYGRSYCGCAAAFIADRFTLDEVADDDIMNSSTRMDAAHPGTLRLLKICSLVAKAAR